MEENPGQAVSILPDDLRQRLPELINEMRRELAPASAKELITALTQSLSLGLGQGMSDAERTEFYAAGADELRSLPRGLALEGLQKARGVCKFAREIAPFVIAYAENYPALARRRLSRLEKLAEEAGHDGRDPGPMRLAAPR